MNSNVTIGKRLLEGRDEGRGDFEIPGHGRDDMGSKGVCQEEIWYCGEGEDGGIIVCNDDSLPRRLG